MNARLRFLAPLLALSVCLCGARLSQGWFFPQKPTPPPDGNVQDFVFLAEARPVLVRVHTTVNGQPLSAAFDDFIKLLFAHLDINGDGALDKKEAERVPAPDQLLNGGFGAFFMPSSGAPKWEALDADKNGKVTRAELSAHYRKSGFKPFQFLLNPNDGAILAQTAIFGGPRPDPDVAAVSKAIFTLLDANKDGKLTKEELAAAPEVLLRMDENEDELVTMQEVVPDAKQPSLREAAMMMNRPDKSGSAKKILIPIAVRGAATPDLVSGLQERYGPRTTAKGTKKKETKLSREALHLDEATFARLDANKDGVLDGTELIGFVKRPPDLCLNLRLGKTDKSKSPLEARLVDGRPSALAEKVKKQAGTLILDLGATRAELLHGEDKDSSRLMAFIRSQLLAQFKAADANGDGCVDAEELKKNRFGGSFKAMDRDGDGKLTEKEFLAYLDKTLELQKRATDACVTLILRDRSRGLFSLLDANGDGKLSVREMRQASKLLKRLDRQGHGYLRQEDVPHYYQMTLRRGTADAENGQESIVDLYFGGGYSKEVSSTRGPAWFRKMDRNRDGDVSRKEFLFSDEQFRKLDADGDGLISLEEAEKAEAKSPKG